MGESNNDSIKKVLTTVILLSLICSFMFSSLVIGLRSKQKNNALLDKQKKIIDISGIEVKNKSIAEVFNQSVETRFINFKTGRILNKNEIEKNSSLKNQWIWIPK